MKISTGCESASASDITTRKREDKLDIRPTICDICNPNTHCGIDAYVKDGEVKRVKASAGHPAGSGALCVKGAASCEYIHHRDRLLTPLLRRGPRGSGRYDPIGWSEALDRIVEKLTRIKQNFGPQAVVFFTGYPKWMRPFLKRLALNFGSPNFATESSTCHTATVVAAKLNYGDAAGADIARTKCLLVWSRNPYHSNLPLSKTLRAAAGRGVKIIDVGPLRTPLTELADVHLRIRPGTSGALALGMARVIIAEKLFDRGFVDKWTVGFQAYADYAAAFTPEATEKITGVAAGDIIAAARLYAQNSPAALISGACPTVHHTNGVQNQRAISALIGLCGNFDVPGGNVVFPSNWVYVANGVPTREAEFKEPRPMSELPPRIGEDRFPVWCRMIPEAQAMHLPFQIESGKPYPVRALVAFGLNHRMWPGSDWVADQIKKLDFVVDVDLFQTESSRLADIILPACSSFERSELKFYGSGHLVWTQPAIAPLGQSRSDVDIICDLARRLTPDDELLTGGHEECVDWVLAPSGLRVAELQKHPRGLAAADARRPAFRKYERGGFNTPSGKMEFTSGVLAAAGIDPLPLFVEPKLSPLSAPQTAERYPLILTTGARLPMFIHSRMYRVDSLRALRPDPMVDMSPVDAEYRGISHLDTVRLSTPRGAVILKANLTETVPPGVVNVYHGHPEADVNTLIDPDYLDPISGFPGFKSLLCQVTRG